MHSFLRAVGFTNIKDHNELEQLSRAVQIWETVKLMKQTVPEFKSKNSKFEKLDRK